MNKNSENKNETNDFVIDPQTQYVVSGEVLCQIRAALLNSALSIQGLLNLVMMAKPFVESDSSELFYMETLEQIQGCEVKLVEQLSVDTSKDKLAIAKELYPDELFFTLGNNSVDFNEAIIGVYEDPKGGAVLAYSSKKVIELFAKQMGEEQAQEHYEFNIATNYFGPKTPLYIHEID